MRRVIPVLLVVMIMAIGQSGKFYLSDDLVKSQSSSSLSLSFPNGPTANEDVTGLYTVTISSSGTGTISSMIIEISSDGSDWDEVVNLTTTPWLTYLDSTSYTNESYTLRVKAYDLSLIHI